jgi:hypothetical protein
MRDDDRMVRGMSMSFYGVFSSLVVDSSVEVSVFWLMIDSLILSLWERVYFSWMPFKVPASVSHTRSECLKRRERCVADNGKSREDEPVEEFMSWAAAKSEEEIVDEKSL